ncbi:MAG: hypothetical protein OEZ06_06775 [Myxococcales bacterium]|nr:hypothetical protein [Myxococcales bacterium]
MGPWALAVLLGACAQGSTAERDTDGVGASGSGASQTGASGTTGSSASGGQGGGSGSSGAGGTGDTAGMMGMAGMTADSTSDCSDGMKLGFETGTDCGGPDCPPCPDDSGCVVDGDCESGLCESGVCQVDGCPDDPAKSEPGVCGCGVPETNSDTDPVPDCQDGCPTDSLKTDPGVCGCGVTDNSADGDGDGTADCVDGCPSDVLKADPGVCGCGVSDIDSDSDGTLDCNDGCRNDPAKTDPGVCGCGVAESTTDSDGDGVMDCADGCPGDPAKTDPGDCGCGEVETDSDGDGTSDCADDCPADPGRTEPGVCGCGASYDDADGDSLYDCDEDGDDDPWTDKNIFNGFNVRQVNTCNSGLISNVECADYDTLAKVDSCMERSIQEQKDQYSGWDWDNAPDNICDAAYGFEPAWSNCDSSWQADWQGFINLPDSGQHCFAVAPGGDEGCTSVFFNGATVPVQDGQTQCFNVGGGIYSIRLHHGMDNGSAAGMHVYYCAGGGSTCTPTEPIASRQLRSSSPCGNGCLVDGACVAAGSVDPSNECRSCNSSTSALGYSSKSNGTACSSDGDSCTADVCSAGVCTHTSPDTDGDGVMDCMDGCPLDTDRSVMGQCGCPSDAPATAGTSCTDGLCPANNQCDGGGNCGSPSQCAPVGGSCSFYRYGGGDASGYWFCTNDQNWQNARAICQSVPGGELVRIDNAGENAFVRSHISNLSWIGGSLSGSSWTWSNNGDQFWSGNDNGSSTCANGTSCAQGSGGLYSNWAASEPDNSSNACAYMSENSAASWGDLGCSNSEDYVCEMPLDACPDDPKLVPGVCGCSVADTDSDGDGTPDCIDNCPADPNKTQPDACGCVGDASPPSAGTTCSDSGCFLNTQCDGAGTCGRRDACDQPHSSCGSLQQYSGHGYWFCTSNNSWANARAICMSRGMDLVRIDDANENAFVRSHISNDSWIGARDSGGGTWVWSDNGDQFWSGTSGGSSTCANGTLCAQGSGGLYSKWNSGEPSSTSGYCARMNEVSNADWNDQSCGNTEDYVCESLDP